jgi:hypothetical protein
MEAIPFQYPFLPDIAGLAHNQYRVPKSQLSAKFETENRHFTLFKRSCLSVKNLARSSVYSEAKALPLRKPSIEFAIPRFVHS